MLYLKAGRFFVLKVIIRIVKNDTRIYNLNLISTWFMVDVLKYKQM